VLRTQAVTEQVVDGTAALQPGVDALLVALLHDGFEDNGNTAGEAPMGTPAALRPSAGAEHEADWLLDAAQAVADSVSSAFGPDAPPLMAAGESSTTQDCDEAFAAGSAPAAVPARFLLPVPSSLHLGAWHLAAEGFVLFSVEECISAVECLPELDTAVTVVADVPSGAVNAGQPSLRYDSALLMVQRQ
jgi:hypothetical protein